MRISRETEWTLNSWKYTLKPRKTRRWGSVNRYKAVERKRVYRVVTFEPADDRNSWSR